MSTQKAAGVVLALITVLAAGAVLFGPALSQDPAYHRFADGRTMIGIRNLLNVATNAPFAVIGALGLWRLTRDGRKRWASIQAACYLLFGAVFLVAFGSAYYHLNPDNATLFWDRLPMAVAFMALLSILVSDRVSQRAGMLLLLPLAFAGFASVEYWRLTGRVLVVASDDCLACRPHKRPAKPGRPHSI